PDSASSANSRSLVTCRSASLAASMACLMCVLSTAAWIAAVAGFAATALRGAGRAVSGTGVVAAEIGTMGGMLPPDFQCNGMQCRCRGPAGLPRSDRDTDYCDCALSCAGEPARCWAARWLAPASRHPLAAGFGHG